MPTAYMMGYSAGLEARLRFRSDQHQGGTAGMAPGHVQGNVISLPSDWAAEFLRYCVLNPKPCPLLGISEPGDWRLPTLGEDIDIRSDLPSYRVWKAGVFQGLAPHVRDIWREDLVTFVLGCSFSLDFVLRDAGILATAPSEGSSTPAFVTSIPTAPAGRFSGPLVVTARCLKAADAIRAIQITSRYPSAHGAPVHIGSPEIIGIESLSRPDYGDAMTCGSDLLPVFWACGLTPVESLMAAAPPLCITHGPEAMLITDLRITAQT